MGLDAAELVMDVEDHFGILILNGEAERVVTVGDLVALIQSRIEAAGETHCPTLSAFLQLRTCVREVASDDKMRIRTGTRVTDVLNPSARRRLWKQMLKTFDLYLPSLRRPPELRFLLLSSAIGALVLAVVPAAKTDIAILPLTLAMAAVFILALHLLTVRFRSIPPDSLATFGLLARHLAGAKVAIKDLKLESPNAILEELRPIIAENLGVDASEVASEIRFIEDLGMG